MTRDSWTLVGAMILSACQDREAASLAQPSFFVLGFVFFSKEDPYVTMSNTGKCKRLLNREHGTASQSRAIIHHYSNSQQEH